MDVKYLVFLGSIGEKYPCREGTSTAYSLPCSPDVDTSTPAFCHWAEITPTLIRMHNHLTTADTPLLYRGPKRNAEAG